MRVIIAGAGEIGWYAAEQLSAAGHDVTLIDNDEERVRQITSELDVRAWSGPASSALTLLEAGVKGADLLAALTGSDETNIVCASIASRLGARRTLARVDEVVYRKSPDMSYREHFGITDFISPEMLAALELASVVRSPGSLAVEHYARGALEMQRFVANKASKNLHRPLAELKIPPGIRIACIRRGDQLLIPQGQDCVEDNDLLTIVGRTDNVDQASLFFGASIAQRKTVVIMGGGHTALSLVRRLRSASHVVTIIERDPRRCEVLSEQLPHVTILHGDGTNLLLLREENIEHADFFISTTSSDEMNIMGAVQAKSLGAAKAFVVIHRPDYVDLVQKMGVDLAVSPRVVMARELLSLLKPGKVHTLAELGGGAAEILELRVENQHLVGKMLRDVKMPASSLILALQRQRDILMPYAEMIFRLNDKILVICHKDTKKDLIHQVVG